MSTIPRIEMSDFAVNAHRPGNGNSYSLLSPSQIATLTREHWHLRQPGLNEQGLDRKVVVPVPADDFLCSTVLLADLPADIPIRARLTRRQEGENLFVQTYISKADASKFNVTPEPAKFAKVVVYSREALLENNGNLTYADSEWEIVCILASPVEVEPMTGLTMARNELEMTGGTKSEYTGRQYADAIHYWSQRIRIAD